MHNDREYLIINGRNLMDFGVYLFGNIPHVFPERDVEVISVPGRTGDLTIDHGRWKNVRVTYQFVMLGDGDKRINDLMAFLLTQNGYMRIEDSRETDYYREGRLVEMPNWRAAIEAGIVKLTFDCKPQKWLVSGDRFMVCAHGTGYVVDNDYTNGDGFFNPTAYASEPLFVVELRDSSYSGEITIKDEMNNVTSKFTVSGTTAPIYIDSQTKLVYKANGDIRHDYVTFNTGSFPIFEGYYYDGVLYSNLGPKGETHVSWTYDSLYDYLAFKPRWWTL